MNSNLIEFNPNGGFQNPTICKKCGGECCNRYPGLCAPSDFGKDMEINLLNAICSGFYSFDYWEGNFEGVDSPYFVRPATIYSVDKLVDPSWGGRCVFLTDKGCELKFDDRPHNCRILEPLADDKCKDHGKGKEYHIKLWLPYQSIIKKIIGLLGGRRIRKYE